MKKLGSIFIPLFALCCIMSNLSAQIGPTIGNPMYDPVSGKTVYRTSDGGIVQYGPTTTGSEVTVIKGGGGSTVIDCTTNPALCRDILRDGADGIPPTIPPADSPGPGDGSGDGSGSGGDPESTSLSGPSAQVWKEYKNYSKQHKGKMYFRSDSGKWSVVEDWKTMHKKVLASIKKG